MRINDLLIESTNQLDEGPKFNKFGQAIGNVAGMAAKGIGAVAGGIAGLGAAAKKGFQAGKSQVAATDDGTTTSKPIAKKAAAGATTAGGIVQPPPSPAAKPKGFLAGVKAGQARGISALTDPAADEEDPAGAAPAAGGTTTPPSVTDINKAGPKGTAQAKPIQGTVAKQAAAKTGAALAGQDQAQAGQTMYSQVKANINKLDKKGKQRILQLLQKSMAAPAAGGAAGGAMGAMAGQLAKGGAEEPNTMANTPVSKTNKAKPGNLNAAAAPDANAPAAVGSSFTYGTRDGQPDVWTKTAKGWENNGSTADGSYGKEIEKAYNQSNKKPAAVAPATDPVATPGAEPTAKSQTLTPQQQAAQAATKARLQGTKAAGKSVAASTTGGFKGAVAGARAKGIATASKINTGSLVLEGFSLFRKK